MEVVILAAAAVLLLEAAVILGCVIWREVSGMRGRAKTEERAAVGSGPYGISRDIDKSEIGAVGTGAHTGPGSSDEKSLEREKRHQEGIDAIMGYDLAVAKRAVRHDAEEE